MVRVVVLDDYQNVAADCARWDVLGGDVDVEFITEHLSSDALMAALANAEVVVAMRERTPFSAHVIAGLPTLRLLVTTGMANSSIDLAAARDHGVVVCGTRSLSSPTVELTWALILGSLRRLPAEDASMRSGEWQTRIGDVLAGKTLGVVGLGRLGQQVAKVGLAFDLQVIAWSTNLDSELATSLGVAPVSKAELLARSDVVTVHLKLGDRSRGTIGAAELRAMKPTAFLVNTSRGPIVEEAALLRALDEGWIAGAAIDVYDVEPLPADHPLRSAPRSVLTPHIGYVVREGYQLFYGDAVEDIAAWRAGAPLRVLSA